jgi:hypothetical protein
VEANVPVLPLEFPHRFHHPVLGSQDAGHALLSALSSSVKSSISYTKVAQTKDTALNSEWMQKISPVCRSHCTLSEPLIVDLVE